MKHRFTFIIHLWLLILGMLLASCTIKYSFTGTSIAPDITTFTIHDFPNTAPLYVPTLSATFTEMLKDKILTQTSLQHTSQNGDLEFEGAITGYRIVPISVQGNETASASRLTITIKVKYTNRKDHKQDFERNFSNYADFDSSQDIADIEQELIEEILDKITDDIYNNTLANW